jgi:uncharacterized repeat protein (TIGR03803 family)
MPRKNPVCAPALLFAAIASLMLAAGTLAAQTYTTIQSFRGFHDEAHASGYPNGGLIADAAGNLYGTTAALGSPCTSSNCGTVFELSPVAGGGYTQTVLHSFTSNGTRPYNPLAGLLMDASGNLYGTTYNGGGENAGTVFMLSKSAGVWTETMLHSFGETTKDGTNPTAALVMDAAGNLYGTARTGGTKGVGIIFELSLVVGRGWNYRELYAFGNGTDGGTPGQLIIDAAGNLYGTAYGGGSHGDGVLFELSPATGGAWTFSIPYSFDSDTGLGGGPYLSVDNAGNIYGVGLGPVGMGYAFELSPSVGGTWTYQKLLDFCSTTCPVGVGPVALTPDNNGNLFGSMYNGGAYHGGTVFELSPQEGGGWSATLLYSFGHGGGASPQGPLLYFNGAVYGATFLGGEYGYGTVYQITP